jgi:hypothetical protein
MCSPAELYIFNVIGPGYCADEIVMETVPSVVSLKRFLLIWNISGGTVGVGVHVLIPVLVGVTVGVIVGDDVIVGVLSGVFVGVAEAVGVGVFVTV